MGGTGHTQDQGGFFTLVLGHPGRVHVAPVVGPPVVVDFAVDVLRVHRRVVRPRERLDGGVRAVGREQRTDHGRVRKQQHAACVEQDGLDGAQLTVLN